MLPMGWIGGEPLDRTLMYHVGTPVPVDWTDTVAARTLTSGIGFSVERRGFAIYNFEQWPPGVSSPVSRPGCSPRRLATLGESSEGAKRAVIQRLRVMNAHLTLLHGAEMHLHREAPEVQRVLERDLYRFDYPDPEDGGEGYWYRPTGEHLPDHITGYDSKRVGTVHLDALDLSLNWLDAVITTDSLLEFDLLNQTQFAAGGHDYALAVTAGWTICELELQALARKYEIALPARTNISKVANALLNANHVSSALVIRLTSVREARNRWLHSGSEPDEEAAFEAQALATDMLQTFVPDLKLSTRPGLLIL